MEKQVITVETKVKASIEQVWESWTSPKHIVHWNFASDDWYAPLAVSKFYEGGTFSNTMAARDGSNRFNFGGTFTQIVPNKRLSYRLDDNRTVEIVFSKAGKSVKIVESFEAESENSLELQQGGWQAILDNFKKYVESLN